MKMLKINNLSNNTNYKFRVYSANNCGNGPYSIESNNITPTTNGSISFNNALEIKNMLPTAPNGVYLINNNLTYCLMDSSFDGGAWMLAMKASLGSTKFNYISSYWTQANTLNHSDANRNNSDAKFHIMNTFQAKDIMAIWPDILVNNGGGAITPNPFNCWTWLENNFFDGNRICLIDFFNTAGTFNTGGVNTGGNYGGYFKGLATNSPNWGNNIFATQKDINFYGFNFKSYPRPFWNYGTARVRWGFGWNDNGEGNYSSPSTLSNSWGYWAGTNDVSNGIGLDSNFGNYSAGDIINCCNNSTGINRSARVEIYIR